MRKSLLLLPLVMLLLLRPPAAAQETIPLYPDTSFHKSGKATLTAYIAEGARTAVVVCPGGSYFWLDHKGEGDEVARWLQQQGISAFVLRYRVPGWGAWFTHYRLLARGVRHPDMYNDGQRALEWLHRHAALCGIDTARIGMMGFSAGGHLVMSEACFRGSRRPAFVAPIYPVVTMSADCVHKRSRRGLMGETDRFKPALRDSLSLEQRIPPDCPPVFLVNCVDDPVVDYRNAVLLDSALTARHIPHRYIQYRTGGHGFGVSETKGTPECRPWKEAFLQWLAAQGLYDPPQQAPSPD